MGKSSGKTQTVNQAPWGPAQGQLRFGLSELDRIYGRPAATQAPAAMSGPFGNTLANAYGFTDRGGPVGGAFRGLNPMSAAPPQAGTAAMLPPVSTVPEYGLVDPAAAELRRTIQGEYLNSNPNLEEVIRRSAADVNSQFAGMGRYGSGAHADMLFTKSAAPIRYANYEAERARQLAAVQAAPGFEMVPFQLNSARTAAPYEGIRNYLGLTLPIAGQGGTQSQPIYNNPLAGAAGGALAGAGLGSMMAAPGATGLAAVGGWPFLLGGALLGGLMS